MNRRSFQVLAMGTCLVQGVFGQGTFQNLDFEAAHDLPAPGRGTFVTNALPGWQAFSGTDQLEGIIYNPEGWGGFYPVNLFGPPAIVINGRFSVDLFAPAAIRQSGLVPSGARSLWFKARGPSPNVSLGGVNLAYAVIVAATNYTLYGADISAFAGRLAALEFSVPQGGSCMIDDIQFVVPEPSTLALLGLGGGWLVARRRKRGQCSG